jgi:hypothetical protein
VSRPADSPKPPTVLQDRDAAHQHDADVRGSPMLRYARSGHRRTPVYVLRSPWLGSQPVKGSRSDTDLRGLFPVSPQILTMTASVAIIDSVAVAQFEASCRLHHGWGQIRHGSALVEALQVHHDREGARSETYPQGQLETCRFLSSLRGDRHVRSSSNRAPAALHEREGDRSERA